MSTLKEISPNGVGGNTLYSLFGGNIAVTWGQHTSGVPPYTMPSSPVPTDTYPPPCT